MAARPFEIRAAEMRAARATRRPAPPAARATAGRCYHPTLRSLRAFRPHPVREEPLLEEGAASVL